MAVMAAAAAGCAAPAFAKDPPKASLAIDPISARTLLAPVEDARPREPGYRLDSGLESATGSRARLSFDLGRANLFAITGRLQRQPAASGPLDIRDARTLGHRRDSGKVYGAGVSTRVHGVDLGATYQYSKISAEQGDSEAAGGTLGRSHSLLATARIRLRH